MNPKTKVKNEALDRLKAQAVDLLLANAKAVANEAGVVNEGELAELAVKMDNWRRSVEDVCGAGGAGEVINTLLNTTCLGESGIINMLADVINGN